MPIELRNLTHVYNSGTAFEKKALDNINLTIEDGEFIGLIGHTGSGKSTLIQHLNALIKPSSGSVHIDGEDINADKSRLKAIRQKVGLVFQYPEHQLFEITIYKDVAFGPGNMNLPQDEIDARVKRALSLVGIIEEDYEKSPFDLSGGQKRRVAIAGVLAMQPKILVLDEPTAGLDPKGRDEILRNIRDMQSALNITVILVSHSMEDIARLVDRIIVMHNGRIDLTGRPAEVFEQAKRLEEIGLAAPQISYLMKALKAKGFAVETEIFTAEEAAAAIAKLADSKQIESAGSLKGV